MDQMMKPFSSEGTDTRRWIVRIIMAVVLGEATVGNLPPGLPVGAPVEVELSFDAAGVLSLFVYSLSTGRRQALEYRPTNRMTLDERSRWRSWFEKLHQHA